MLLAIAMPIQWVSLPPVLELGLIWCLLLGTYLLVLGMFVGAIWRRRGIPGGGSGLNRLVSGLYEAGTVLSLLGSALLVLGLFRTYCCVRVA
jgi:vacuolar-type H+-ATPase subunit I/STV1